MKVKNLLQTKALGEILVLMRAVTPVKVGLAATRAVEKGARRTMRPVAAQTMTRPALTELARVGATVARKRGRSAFIATCGVALGGLVLSFVAVAGGPSSSPRTSNVQTGNVQTTTAEVQRLVTFFFSAEAWGGVPFSEAEKQKVMVDAMLTGQPTRIESEVTHLLSTPEAHVRSFVAVFEVDGSVRPPSMRAGYELELLVPQSREALTVELINGDTGIVNLVEVAP
jgi:hypothetical protein